ncbi:MAG: hypothetical protein FWE02_04775 [Defluviitaleaceae bacterium]|nr:hypothetical protein [Defluviitaleaceae bacterium]
MPKRLIPLTLAMIALVFTIGLTRGARSEADLHLYRQAIQRHIGTTIAVVNADIGAYINGYTYNYAAAIIDTLGDDFVLVSPAMADTGFNSGVYGAIVTFPSDVSTRILSFNAYMPERVQLEFQVNPALPERAFLETYVAITDLQLSINTTLANTYIASIFRQFHDAQDQVEGVFQNNLADLMALELLTLEDFTYNLEFDALPDLPMEFRELDTQFHMQQVASFASEVAGWYLHSYGLASDSFLWMREGLFRLTDNFPYQEEDWLRAVADWTEYSVEYGELLEEFADEVREHEYHLQEWHTENLGWHEELQFYSDEVHNFHNDNLGWFNIAMNWHVQYLGYLNLVLDYSYDIRAHRQLLYDSIQPVKTDITDWFEALTQYEDGLYGQFEALLVVIEDHNMQSEVTNAFLIDLLAWHTGLEDSQSDLFDWQDDMNNRLMNLNEWQYELETVQEHWEETFYTYSYLVDNFNMPDEFTTEIEIYDYLYYLTNTDNIPNFEKLYLPSSPLENLYAPSITLNFPTNLVVPSINDIPDQAYGDWFGFLADIETAILELENLYEDLTYAYGKISNWNSDLQELENWHDSLYTFYGEVEQIFIDVYDWSNELFDFSDSLFELGYEFMDYKTIILEWHEDAAELYYNLNELQLSELPDYSQFEYLNQLEEILVDMPDALDPLEPVIVPQWNEELASPGSYDGAEIAEAFTSEFPLDNDALSHTPGLEVIRDERERHLPFAVEPTNILFEFANMPESPLQDSPPRPDDFWDSLDDMHDQLSQFDVNAFLGDDIHARVANSLNGFDSYLGTVRDDASFQFEHNLWQLDNVRHGYTRFLESMRRDASHAQREEQQALQYSIDDFAYARGITSDNTRYRLASFANMMPESRATTGVNQTLVNFAAAPFEFVPVGLREEVSFDHLALLDTMEYQYSSIQQIVLAVVIGIFAITVVGSLIYELRKRRIGERTKVRRI